jgi:hypothetical protein
MLNENIELAAPPPPWSEEDIYIRLIQQLPNWWGSDHAVVDVLLEAFITTNLLNYAQFSYVFLQLRLQTCTGDNLDLFSQDYFGGYLPRRFDESDDSYRNRISATLLQEKSTRYGMQNALFLLTGIEPVIFEPWNPYDCGGYNVASTMGYDIAGSYGSGSYPAQVFIDVYVNGYDQMGGYSGYNDYYGGYNASGGLAALWYGGDSLIGIVVSDQDIYDTINLTKPEGVWCWVAIHRTLT